MPLKIRYEHFEFPKHLELPVLAELPEDFEIRSVFHSFKEAWTKLNLNGGKDDLRFMTHCRHCGGWVPGRAHEHHVNTLDGHRLAWRKGTEFYCPRCANEIAFEGIMS